MNLLRDAPLWVQLLLVSVLLGAAVQDVVQRRISNWLSLMVVVAAGLAAIATGPTLALWQNAVIFTVLLGVGMPLFAAGWLGGGDVKLIAALGLWANFASILPLLACILIAGGALAAMSLALKGGRAARRARGVPYGVAIGAGALLIFLQPQLLGDPGPPSPLDLEAARKRTVSP